MEAIPESHAVIGVDLGGTKLLAGAFDADSRELARERVEIGGLDSGELVEALVGVVERLADAAGVPIVAAGFGIPTTIDQRTGTAVVAANLPIKDLPLRDILRERTGMDVFLDNDGNVAALAEQRLGVGAGVADDLLMVTLGTGFGGGIIAGGRIQRGAIGAGAEMGHMSIDFDGPTCAAPNCPGIGCIEAFVGGNAMMRTVREFVDEHPDSALATAVAAGAPAAGETVVRLAGDGDADCVAILERFGFHLGVALASFVNIFNPRMIAVGGGMTPALPIALPVARSVVLERALAPGNEFVEIVEASFGPDAGMVGAALMARDGLREMQTA